MSCLHICSHLASYCFHCVSTVVSQTADLSFFLSFQLWVLTVVSGEGTGLSNVIFIGVGAVVTGSL